MSRLIDEFKKKSYFYSEKGASLEMISKAEEALCLKFADDYKEYLQLYGSVSCGGHELTGFSEDVNLDVVEVTLKNREKNRNMNLPLYVVEETHIDGIVIWQSESGEVFQTQYKEKPERIYESLFEYIETFENAE